MLALGEVLFSVRNLFKSTGAAALRCAKKESVAKKIPDRPKKSKTRAQRSTIHMVKGCFRLLSISNSSFTGTCTTRLTCKFTSSLNSKIGLFRSSTCPSSELRTFGNDRPMGRDFSYPLFCHDHLSLQSKFKLNSLRVLVILGSLNSFCPVSCTKLTMENLEEASDFESNTKGIEIGAAFVQPEESKHVTEDVTDVNQKDTSTNQDSCPVSSFTQDKVPTDLKEEKQSERDFDQETYTLETSGRVSELAEEQERHQILDTEITKCFQNTENEKDSDVHCDDGSFGLETLFDEDLHVHHNDAAGWITQSKAKIKQGKRKKRKRKLQLNALSDDDDTDMASTSGSKDDGLLPKGKKKPKRITPNYFLAIRVSSPQIHSAIKIVQDSIATHNEKLTPALIPLETLHLTLMVTHLENDEQIQKATEVLKQCKISLDPILRNNALTMTFSGLGHFNHQVLYAKLCGGEQMEVLKSVVNIVRETFTKEGIPSTDSREFSPHLTVMKLSRNPTLRRKGIKKIPEESYASWVDMSFGEEPVNAVHLCSMNKKEKDGFYKCEATVTFNDAANEPPSTETGNTRREADVAQDNNIGDVEQEATSSSAALCDKNTGGNGKNVEENAPCDEDLSKELGSWTVDDNVEDEVTKEPSELQGDSERNGRKSDH